MTIQAILNNKGADVIAIDAGSSVRDALKVMDKRAIGAILVTGGDLENPGIFTERDVTRALAAHDVHCLDDAVAKHMTPRPQTITLATSVVEAMEIMTERRFRHLPVMDGAKLCGIISIGDLVNYRIREAEMEAAALKEYITTG